MAKAHTDYLIKKAFALVGIVPWAPQDVIDKCRADQNSTLKFEDFCRRQGDDEPADNESPGQSDDVDVVAPATPPRSDTAADELYNWSQTTSQPLPGDRLPKIQKRRRLNTSPTKRVAFAREYDFEAYSREVDEETVST